MKTKTIRRQRGWPKKFRWLVTDPDGSRYLYTLRPRRFWHWGWSWGDGIERCQVKPVAPPREPWATLRRIVA